MIPLSISDINAKAPYTVLPTGSEGFVTFSTDFGVRYMVGFDADDTSMSFMVYQLVIVNANNRKSPNDPKVKYTIIAIVEEFFSKNNETLLYICETGDDKQTMRSRLFEYWFTQYERRLQFTFLTTSIIDEEGVVNYATIILRNDNPHITEIVNEFTSTIKYLSQKPD